jgi:hypothetical protein
LLPHALSLTRLAASAPAGLLAWENPVFDCDSEPAFVNGELERFTLAADLQVNGAPLHPSDKCREMVRAGDPLAGIGQHDILLPQPDLLGLGFRGNIRNDNFGLVETQSQAKSLAEFPGLGIEWLAARIAWMTCKPFWQASAASCALFDTEDMSPMTR